VRLTAAGVRRLDRAAQAQREAEAELFAGLSDAQREELGAVLLALRDTLAVEPSTGCTSADAP